MFNLRITSRGRVTSVLLGLFALGGLASQASAQTLTVPISTVYESICAACHLNPLKTANPEGTILSWSALDVTSNIPQAMKTSANAPGFANGNMLPSYITSRSDAELTQIYNYLRAVRDGLSTPGSLSFASTTVGDTSASKNIKLGNLRGTSFPFSFSKSGSHQGDFSVTRSAGCSVSIAAASSASNPSECSLSVDFSPGSAGNRTASLNVTFNGGGTTPSNTQSFPLSGTGTAAPAPVFSYQAEGNLALSSVVGTTTDKKIGTISNTGNANLTLGTLKFTPSDEFAIDTTQCRSNQVLGAGTNCSLVVKFTPTATGNRSATLDIPHDGPPGTRQVQVNGTGQPVPVATLDLGGLTALSFGRIALGSASGPQSFTIRNSGTATLSISGLPITQGGTEFSRTGGTCPTTFPFNLGTTGGSNNCSVELGYRPASAGASAAARVNINSNASNGTPAPSISLSGFGLPHATATPATVAAFPDTTFGATSTERRTVTVSNPRDAAIGYSRSLGGANAADFAVVAGSESCASMQVPASSSCTMEVSFTPLAAGGASTRNASLQFSFTGTAGDPAPQPVSVALSGSAIQPTPTFEISVSSLAFSAVVGTPNSASATIRNTGTANLDLSSFTFGGAFGAEYSLAAASTCGVGSTLPPGSTANSSCTLAILFSPADVGTRAATLAIAHNAAGSPKTITLDGVASAAPVGTIDLQGSTGLAFGGVGLGSNAQQAISVRNIGSAALNITAFTINGAHAGDFVRTGSCTTGALAIGADCSVIVTFTPAALGARSANLAIASDASNAAIAANLGLSGEGLALAEPGISPNPLDAFPATTIGSLSSVTRIVTVSNPRSKSISYTRALGGGDAADFTISNESCPTGSIAAAASCTISLQFRPTDSGAAAVRNAILSLTFAGSGGDPAPAPRTVAISGSVSTQTAQISLSANSLAFTAVVGNNVTRTAIVSNAGGAPLSLSNLVISGAAASEYSLAASNVCSATTVLTPGNSCLLAVRFAPSRLGTLDASLAISHSAAGSPATVSLRGTGTSTPQGRIEFSSFSLAFPDTQVGASAALSVNAVNQGDAALTLGAISISGASASAFERSGTCQAGTLLAIGQDCSLTITFRPAAAGLQSATLLVNSDASNGAGSIALSGSGTTAAAPLLSLPTTLAFGSQTLGGLYQDRSVLLKNSGTALLLLNSIAVEGAGFVITEASNCPASLEPGAGCEVTIRFTPAAADTDYSGKLNVVSNSTGSPQNTALTGRGTSSAMPALSFATPTPELSFGSVSAGSLSTTQTLTLLNQGPGGVVFTLLNAVGTDNAAFSVTGGTCQMTLPGQPAQVLFQGQTCTIEILFAPSSAGEKTATLQIVSSGNFPPTLVLRGTGTAGPSANLELSVAALGFEPTRVGTQSQPLELRLSSTGSGTIRVTALDVSGPYLLQNKTCPALPFSLSPGSECTVTVMFTPSAEGSAAGTLSITTDAQTQAFILALSGQANPNAQTSSGGCSLASGNSAVDPTMWLLVWLSIAALIYRHRARVAQRRKRHNA